MSTIDVHQFRPGVEQIGSVSMAQLVRADLFLDAGHRSIDKHFGAELETFRQFFNVLQVQLAVTAENLRRDALAADFLLEIRLRQAVFIHQEA